MRARSCVGVVGPVLGRGLLAGAVVMGLLGLWATTAWAGSWTALVANDTASSVTAVDLGQTPAPGNTAGVGTQPLGIAIAPDGRTAYVINAGASSGQLTQLSLSNGSVTSVQSVTVGTAGDNFIAISPDGTKAYVSDAANSMVYPVDLTGATPTVGMAINAGTNPEGIAFSPDGQTAYVADNANGSGTPGVTPIAVATNAPGQQIAVGSHPFAIAITPDGSTAYVTNLGSGSDGKVYPIDLGTATPGSGIQIGTNLAGIAITPDGSKAYVTDSSTDDVTPIALPSNLVGMPIALTGTHPFAVAVTPDSKTAWVSDSTGSTITPIDTATDMPGSPISVGSDPEGIAITPDQAPTAAFNVSGGQAGSAVGFDASPSTTPVGTLTSFAWSFGDGSSAVTSSPSTSHVYQAPGNYTATVTVTNSAGTSLNQVFTGQTVSREGGPVATTGRTVTVSAGPAPAAVPSVGHLDYGSLGVGSAGPAQSVTVTNTGTAVLHVGAVSIGGTDPGDYAKSGDGCSGATVPVGGSCAVSVVFSPKAGGTRAALLQIADDAGGSPQVVSLTGTGLTTGGVTGVVDAVTGSDTTPHPFGGAVVAVCRPGLVDCIDTTSSADGSYTVSNLTPGPYHVEFYPPIGSDLLNDSLDAVIPAGAATAISPTLHPAQSFPAGVTVTSAGQGTYNGEPVVHPGQPYQIEFPFDVDPAATALTPGPPSPCVYSVLTVALDFHTPAGVNGGTSYSYTGQQQIVMVYGRNGASGYTFETQTGDYLTNPTQTVVQPISGGARVTWSIASGGALVVSFSDPQGIFGPQGRNVHGTITQHVQMTNAWSCSVDDDSDTDSDESDDDTFVDPSGYIHTTAGVPLANAVATLLRAAPGSKRFTAPRTGDHSLFDPAINPLHTDVFGHYGWDVVPGRYRVLVRHAGCTSLTTRIVGVPPPVTNLNLRLHCHGLKRTASHAQLSLPRGTSAGRGFVAQATIHSRGHAPAGEVLVQIGRATYSGVLNRSGRALVGVPGLRAGRYVVRLSYPGDALHVQTTARTTLRVLPTRRRKPPAGAGAPRPG